LTFLYFKHFRRVCQLRVSGEGIFQTFLFLSWGSFSAFSGTTDSFCILAGRRLGRRNNINKRLKENKEKNGLEQNCLEMTGLKKEKIALLKIGLIAYERWVDYWSIV